MFGFNDVLYNGRFCSKTEADEQRKSDLELLEEAFGNENLTKKSKYNFLPSDVESVIIHDNTVIVKLNDGRKGVSKCHRKDEFDTFTGFTIAYYKAKNSKSFKLKEVLDNCLQSANEKGYDKAILKNY